MTTTGTLLACGPLALGAALLLGAPQGADGPPRDLKAHRQAWPQWRGPGRTNASAETGLLHAWPKAGPPLAWKADGLGTTATSISVAGGRVFALGYHGEAEYLQALDEVTGKPLWKVRLESGVRQYNVMQWLNQRSPTVDGERVYVLSTGGLLHCLEAATGKERWRKDYARDFGGRRGPWGFCDFPLVDGDRLICTPGGERAALVALDKRTGALLWRAAVPGVVQGAHGAVVAADLAGTRMYVHQLESGTVGVSAANGKVLWTYARTATRSGNVHTALVAGDRVFCSCGWGTGWGLVRVARDKDTFRAEELYFVKGNLDPWLGSSVLVGGEVHTSCGKRIDLATGKLREDLRLARGTVVYADGRLYRRKSDGTLLLHEITPGGYVVRGEFLPPRAGRAPPWSFPVISGGKLFIRDQGLLLCYDVRRPDGGRLPAQLNPPHGPSCGRPPLDPGALASAD
jgi:outer membrane protein assembly factor BamB